MIKNKIKLENAYTHTGLGKRAAYKMTVKANLAIALQQTRERMCLTQKEFAKATGLKHKTVKAIEQGSFREIGAEVMLMALAACEVDQAVFDLKNCKLSVIDDGFKLPDPSIESTVDNLKPYSDIYGTSEGYQLAVKTSLADRLTFTRKHLSMRRRAFAETAGLTTQQVRDCESHEFADVPMELMLYALSKLGYEGVQINLRGAKILTTGATT